MKNPGGKVNRTIYHLHMAVSSPPQPLRCYSTVTLPFKFRVPPTEVGKNRTECYLGWIKRLTTLFPNGSVRIPTFEVIPTFETENGQAFKFQLMLLDCVVQKIQLLWPFWILKSRKKYKCRGR